MQCEEFEARLQDLLDLRLTPETDGPLQWHAEQCDECRQVLAAQQKLRRGLQRHWAPPPPPGFAQRVLAQLHPPVPPPPELAPATPHLRWPTASQPAALAVLLALSALLLATLFAIPPADPPSTAQPLTAPQPAAPQPHDPSPPPPADSLPGRPALDEFRLPMVQLPPRRPPIVELAAELHPGPDHQPPAAIELGPWLAHWKDKLPEMPTEPFDHVDHLSGGLRPLTTSFSVALDALRRTLPGGKEQTQLQKPQAGTGVGLPGVDLPALS